ncbi:MAG: transglutaminase domain-containing protein [Nitrospinae bacterium]|nr:transglutaminase domain-containing protein [Nitrospinota bacterium]
MVVLLAAGPPEGQAKDHISGAAGGKQAHVSGSGDSKPGHVSGGAKNHISGSAVESKEPGTVYPPLVSREEWAGTYFKGKKLGFSHWRVHISGNSVTVNSKTYMRLQSPEGDQITSFAQETQLSPDLRLQGFSLLQEITGHRQKVEARAKDGQLVYGVSTLGYDKEKTMPLSPGLAPSSTYLLNIFKNGLRVGAKGTIPLFVEPFQMLTALEYRVLRREKISFDGRPAEAFVISQKASGIESTLWVLEDGSVARELTNQGFESRKESKESAQSFKEGTISVSSFITLSMVKAQREIDNPQSRRKMKLKFSQLKNPEMIPRDRRQTPLKTERHDDQSYSAVLMVESEPPMSLRPAPLPVEKVEDPQLLEDSAEIQSKNPLIRALSQQLVRGNPNSWQAALRINRWVYQNLDKALVDTFTALDALRERRGECQSHTNLFTALARAAGIPTRVVNGLVYSPEYKGFLYHAWPEVYVGEWRALDPTFGQEIVDATHIKLSVGDAAAQFKLMEFIGQLSVEPIE